MFWCFFWLYTPQYSGIMIECYIYVPDLWTLAILAFDNFLSWTSVYSSSQGRLCVFFFLLSLLPSRKFNSLNKYCIYFYLNWFTLIWCTFPSALRFNERRHDSVNTIIIVGDVFVIYDLFVITAILSFLKKNVFTEDCGFPM